MNICPVCEKKFIRNDYYEKHLETHPSEEAKQEEVQDAVVEAEEKAETPVETDEVLLKFSKPVEVYINGVPYVGKEVKAPNMKIASEVVRIAREAYGRGILN